MSFEFPNQPTLPVLSRSHTNVILNAVKLSFCRFKASQPVFCLKKLILQHFYFPSDPLSLVEISVATLHVLFLSSHYHGISYDQQNYLFPTKLNLNNSN
jgi:hypothetical protein